MKRWAFTFVLCGVWLGAGSAATAQSFTTATATPTAARAARTAPPIRTEPRPVPEYDGRPEWPPGETSGIRGLIWIPRVLLSPVWFVSEFGVRRPLGALLTWAEKEDVPFLLLDFFTLGPKRKVGIVPTVLVEFNLRPSGGLFFFADDVGISGHDIRARVAVGGSDWMVLWIRDSWELFDGLKVGGTFGIRERPDYVFHGLGPNSFRDDRVRYRRRDLGGGLFADYQPATLFRMQAELRFEDHEFGSVPGVLNDPSLAQGVRLGFFPEPPGLEGYTVIRSRGGVHFDSRSDLRRNGTGLSVRAELDHAFEPADPAAGWLRVSSTAGAHLDLGHNRLVSVYGHLGGVFDDDQNPAPFSERFVSGGKVENLGGFLPGRLTGDTVAAATLDYRYEVGAGLDGQLFVSMGNVFSDGFQDFDTGRLRLSYGLGLVSLRNALLGLRLMWTVGHRTIEQGGAVDSVRFVLGAEPSF